jgi:uncharacterized RDD family membrane protein YckC
MTADTPQPYPAPLGWRIAAALYDLMPLIALWFVTAALALLVTQGTLDYHAWWYRLSLLVVTAGYFVLSWRNGGQTIGMRAWRLRVVDENGASPTYTASLLRFAVSVVSLAAACLGFLWCLYDRDRRAWHDLAAHTRLVRYPKPKKAKSPA